MIKTLQNTLKQDKERFIVPRSVQDIIPIRRIWPDGVFQFGSKYSKTLRFSDINYAIASKEDKTAMFLSYSELLNALDTGSTTKITINNKRLDRRNFEQEILIPTKGDDLDGGRKEYNAMLLDKVTDSSNSVVQERYITLSVHKKNVEEARAFFDRTVHDAASRLNHMDSHCEELDAADRLHILHDFYRVGEESEFRFDLRENMKNGHSIKDAICPDSMEFKKDHFIMGGKYGRVLFLKEYASYIKDSMINELTSLNRSLMLSIDIIPVPTDEAVREMQNRLLGVETNVTNWQRRQNANNNFSAVVPYDLEQQRKETREMLDDLTTRDQRMMFAVVTLVHLADSKEELDSDTETLQSIARKHLCQLTTLNWQQADGLVTALPLGLRRIDALRTLTTEALAVLMPFKAQEIWDRGGVYYGQNAISKNLIVADRRQLLNGNAFILGVSGSGKSFSAKKEMVSLALSTQDDIIVIDPESEYRPLIEGLGGQVINISATSPNHINAMDMEQGYGDGENPVVLKSEFLLSLCEQLIGAGKLSAKEKSVIDRCTAQVYRDYIRSGYHGAVPTLQDFHAELLRQPEKEAQDVALAIELFTDGSLNTFAKPTNVDTNARILCYDIRDLGKQLLPVGMLVVLDSIFNRIIRNRGLKRNTWIYIDEIYLLFQHEYSANFLFTLWKRMRKYQACGTGISQNIEDLLQSHTARTMLANSEFLIMLNQAATDREELARLLNISDNQLSYITNVDSGRGLIKCGSAIVPFVDSFPRHTRLYQMMTTRPSDLVA
ncbi:VirB4-like conjugal transfer ATPase, CD1110 family [Agathobaculum sp. LCP25S3_E8]|uniref:VirB4-like conjugal transfer ATPase, CD1110 family n=1 Tax=Agathobaculum sp. LCP25S3_E8 TaxID=3438735 RepID=UPI003F93ABFA